MGVQGSESNPRCDSLSLMSFSDAKQMWGNPAIVALYPERSAFGTQMGVYHSDCLPLSSESLAASQANFVNAQQNYQATLAKIEALKMALERMLESKGSRQNSVDQTWIKSQTEVVQDIRKSLSDLYFGKVPYQFNRELDCARQLLERLPLNSCPGKAAPTNQVIQKYFLDDAGGGIWTTAVGGADCHKGQLNINGAIQ